MGTLEKQSAQVAAMQGKLVYFGTNVLAYLFNVDGPFWRASIPFVQALGSQHYRGITGEITLGELLVKPSRDNDLASKSKMKAFFDKAKIVSLASHERQDYELMAEIRATLNLKAIDALHCATAVRLGCDYITTADKKMASRVIGIETINLNDYLA